LRRTNLCRECARKWLQQIARVLLGAEPAGMLLDCNDGRHAVVDRSIWVTRLRKRDIRRQQLTYGQMCYTAICLVTVCRQAFKMAPSINVTDPTFARLQKFAKPLIDTPESVIIRLMDAFEKKQSVSPPNGAKEYGAGAAPNLTHTKVLSIELNGTDCPKSETNWNRLLDDVINQAAKKLKDVTALKELLVVNHVIGKKEDQGYRYLASAGISVQGQDANSAWKAVAHIIKSMNFSCRVIFMWYDNDKAAHPGQTGKFTLNLD
jgi:hypothetical protein